MNVLLNICFENAHSAVQSCLNLCDFMDYSPSGSSAQGFFPGKNAGVGWHFLLQCFESMFR